MMVASLGQDRIEAVRGLERRPDYQCPTCGNPVVMHARTGGWVIPHFKHKANSSCLNGKGESPAHRAVKVLLRDHYRAKGHEVELECNVGTRRADIFVADIGVAFEVEFSPKEALEFISKCRDYARRNVRSAWVLRQKQINVAKVRVGNQVLISMSRVLGVLCSRRKPRGAGAAFFAYDNNEAVVFRGNLSSLMLYKEYDDYRGAGGYEYPSRSRMRLLVKEVIRMELPAPQFPGSDAKRAPAPEHRIEASKAFLALVA